MPNGPWTDEENDLIVADYFAMLAKDLADRPYSKTEHRRTLLPKLDNRSEASIRRKHHNISAVLQALGETWLPGYVPAFNFQMTLVDAVARRLALDTDLPDRMPGVTGAPQAERLPIGPPPTLGNGPPPRGMEKMLTVARKYDMAGRDERNRALGKAGERRVLRHERTVLISAGREDLARQVRWVSREDGDGAGYDIASFAPDERPRLIEVKTTESWQWTPFHVSRNELRVARGNPDWLLLRLWDFSNGAKAFELYPPLERHVLLTPTSFRADLR